MKSKNNQNAKHAFLSADSNVQDSLKALFLHGAEYLFFYDEADCFFCHKDKLISLLERGKESVSLSLLKAEIGALHPSTTAFNMDEPIRGTVLCLVYGEVYCKTPKEFFEMQEELSSAILPEWWNVPLPMLFFSGEKVHVNPTASSVLGIESAQADTLRASVERGIHSGDFLLEIPSNQGEGVYAMNKVCENVYFIEDISADAEMAEQLIWWAAVGRTLVTRMESNGLKITHHRIGDSLPENTLETLSCSWDENELGFISVTELNAEEDKIAIDCKEERESTH